MKTEHIVIIVIIILVLLIILIYIAKNINLSNSLSKKPKASPTPTPPQYIQYHSYEFSIYDKNDPSTIFLIYSRFRTLENKKIVDDDYIFNKFTIVDYDVVYLDNLKNFIKIFGIYEFEFDMIQDIEGQINSKYNSSLENQIDSPFIIDIKNRKENKKIVSIPVLMKMNENNIELYNEYNNTRIKLYYKPKPIQSETKLIQSETKPIQSETKLMNN